MKSDAANSGDKTMTFDEFSKLSIDFGNKANLDGISEAFGKEGYMEFLKAADFDVDKAVEWMNEHYT